MSFSKLVYVGFLCGKEEITKLVTMKLFQVFRKCMDTIGLRDPITKQENAFPFKRFIFPIYLWLSVASSSMFFVFEAETFDEYSESFYTIATAICLGSFNTEFVRNSSSIFELITKFEENIQKRELTT